MPHSDSDLQNVQSTLSPNSVKKAAKKAARAARAASKDAACDFVAEETPVLPAKIRDIADFIQLSIWPLLNDIKRQLSVSNAKADDFMDRIEDLEEIIEVNKTQIHQLQVVVTQRDTDMVNLVKSNSAVLSRYKSLILVQNNVEQRDRDRGIRFVNLKYHGPTTAWQCSRNLFSRFCGASFEACQGCR